MISSKYLGKIWNIEILALGLFFPARFCQNKIIFAFGIWNFDHCDLFGIWYLCFGISGLSGLGCD